MAIALRPQICDVTSPYVYRSLRAAPALATCLGSILRVDFMAQGLNKNETDIADLRYSETNADFTLLGYLENKVRSLFVSQCE